jgi:trans-aconitate methyltransferase
MTNDTMDFYPAMSHPPAHPSVIAATALLGGIRLDPEQDWSILEIGCASGHHILPIAESFPQASITAIDLDARAIEEAKRLAQIAGLRNIEFHCEDLTTWQAPARHYDIIIAHGVFSWIPDTAKTALLALCERALKENGVAMISYNTLPGWTMRQPLREMTLALQQMPAHQGSACSVLQSIAQSLQDRDDAYAKYLLDVIYDTHAKGDEQLRYDDLAPHNEPCYFSQFFQWIQQSGLTYVGEADSTLPQTSLLGSAAKQQLQSLAANPLLMEQMTDFLTGRSFRCSVICRTNTPRKAPTPEELADLCIERLMPIPATGNDSTDAFAQAIMRTTPCCRSIKDLLVKAAQIDLSQALKLSLSLLSLGMIRLRLMPIIVCDEMPEFPRLSELNRDHLKQGKPIVDAFHRPCQLAPNDRNWLRLCDGSVSFEQLMKACRGDTQVQALHELLAHMNERGLFV